MRILKTASILVAIVVHAILAIAQAPDELLPAYNVSESLATDAAQPVSASQPIPAASSQAAGYAIANPYQAAASVPQGAYVIPDGQPVPTGGHYVPAWIYVPDDYDPCWTLRFDIPALQRSTTRSQPLFVDGQQQPLLNSQTDLNFPVQAGLQLDLIRQLSNGWELEFGLFSIDGWVAHNWVPGQSYMVIGDDSIFSSDGDARYRSSLSTFEVNLRRQWTENIAFLAGFRCGSLDERYTAWGGHHNDEWLFTSNPTNSLFGFQIGTDLKLLTRGPLSIGGSCKAGIYGNAIEQRSRLANYYLEGRLEESVGQVAFLGEVGLTATYQFTPRFSAKVFYQAAWLEGVALAPEQIGGTDFLTGTVAINPDGGLFYHGGGLGLEWKF